MQTAERDLAAARGETETHSSSVLQKIATFEELQQSIDRRIVLAAQTEDLDDAAKRMRIPMEKMRRVDLAKSYLHLLEDVEELADEARGYLPARPKEALKAYVKLQQLSIDVYKLEHAAEIGGMHLGGHIEKSAKNLWLGMEKIMSDDFESILSVTKWPFSKEAFSDGFGANFERLLDLQTLELKHAKEPIVLLPMAVLCKSYVQEFRYHFMGDRSTNRKDQVSFFVIS